MMSELILASLQIFFDDSVRNVATAKTTDLVTVIVNSPPITNSLGSVLDTGRYF